MNWKKMIALTLTSATVAAATASSAPTLDQLWAQADREAQWTPLNLQASGLQGPIQAFRTDTGTVKVEALADRYVSAATLQSPQFARYNGQPQFLKECQKQAGIFSAIRRLNNPYTMQMRVLPSKSTGLDYQTADGTAVSSVANQFLKPDHVQVAVQVAADALVRNGQDFDAQDLQQNLTAQAQNALDKDAIVNGALAFNLNGMDDLVCDLVAGKVKIQTQIWYHFSRAKLQRETRLTAGNGAKLYEAIRQRFQSGDDARANLILGSVQLGKALERTQPLAPEASDAEIVRLQNLLFEPAQNTLRSLSSSDLTQVAARMDRLSDGFTYGMPVFEAEVASPFTGEGSGQ